MRICQYREFIKIEFKVEQKTWNVSITFTSSGSFRITWKNSDVTRSIKITTERLIAGLFSVYRKNIELKLYLHGWVKMEIIVVESI